MKNTSKSTLTKKLTVDSLNNIFEETNPGKGIFVQWFIAILISLNVVAIIIDSFNDIHEKVKLFLYWFEVFSIAIFTAEYILRLISSPAKYKKRNLSYLIYVFSFMGIVDLLSILPFYFSFFIISDLRFLRVFRLLRIFKLFRHFEALDTLSNVIKNEKNKLIMAFSVLLVLLVFASSAMYYIENHYQPDQFANIISTFWWAVATLTTIGYGDVYPVTAIGRFLGGLISILGIGIIALPSGIISAGLIKEANNKDKYGTVKKYKDYTRDLELKIMRIHQKILADFKYVKGVWFKSNIISGEKILDYASWSKYFKDKKKVFYAYIKLIDPCPYLQLLMCNISDLNYNIEKKFEAKNGLVPSGGMSEISGMNKFYSFNNNLGEFRYCQIDLMTISLGGDDDEFKEIEEIIKILGDFDNKIEHEPKIKRLELLVNETIEDKENEKTIE